MHGRVAALHILVGHKNVVSWQLVLIYRWSPTIGESLVGKQPTWKLTLSYNHLMLRERERERERAYLSSIQDENLTHIYLLPIHLKWLQKT
jgi:hypothetical protein